MRWPRDKVAYVGIDPAYMVEGTAEWDGGRAEEVRTGERERGLAAWEADRFGTGVVLGLKRRERNPWGCRQLLFQHESSAERRRCGIRSKILNRGDWPEENLIDEPQPWDESAGSR